MDIEERKLELERHKVNVDLLKWIAIAVAAVVSFYVIDYGKLRLEQSKQETLHDRELLKSYLAAMDSAKPEVWKRKLRFIRSFSKDDRIVSWAEDQLNTLSSLPPRESLYLEAVKVAKVLARRAPRDEDAWKRFEELYWSELPLAKESLAMESAMVGFRQSVINAQEAPIGNDNKEWGAVKKALLHLSRVVSAEVPNKTIQPTAESGG